MRKTKSTFAVFPGNRGFFSESLIAGARREMREVLEKLGHQVLMMPEDATRYGAVETAEDGAKFADFIKEHRNEVDGIIISLPNFGDETGAVAACHDAGVPIMIQAYPDELEKMAMSTRRDAFCGKFSVMDVFYQYQVPFTVFPPHTVHPEQAEFSLQIEQFDRICRICRGMKNMVVGAIGARTTAFKTVRFDELALQKHGITTETFDLSDIFARIREVKESDAAYIDKAEVLRNYTCWNDTPATTFANLVRLGVVLDRLIEECQLDALAFRCWIEIEKEFSMAPCVVMSELNNRGISAACELDVCNAVSMHALNLASAKPAACLDWNNNYGDEDDKCILFHCGPVPAELMAGPGSIVDHPMFAKALGAGHGFGCNTGRIKSMPFTYASSKTENGELMFYLGEGQITDDVVPADFFGCAGVAQIDNLQKVLLNIGLNGYRHHVSITEGCVRSAIDEAFTKYLGYQTEAW